MILIKRTQFCPSLPSPFSQKMGRREPGCFVKKFNLKPPRFLSTDETDDTGFKREGREEENIKEREF
jgi:hypothetical protein